MPTPDPTPPEMYKKCLETILSDTPDNRGLDEMFMAAMDQFSFTNSKYKDEQTSLYKKMEDMAVEHAMRIIAHGNGPDGLTISDEQNRKLINSLTDDEARLVVSLVCSGMIMTTFIRGLDEQFKAGQTSHN